jgi:hypothetical protein
LRTSPDGRQQVLCLQNVSDQTLSLNLSQFDLPDEGFDILTGTLFSKGELRHLEITPYQTRWFGADLEQSPRGPLQ